MKRKDCPKDCSYYANCGGPDAAWTVCMRYIQFSRLLELSNLPAMYWKPIKIYGVDEDMDVYQTLDQIKNRINEFVQKGENLYICSKTCGNAKTTWAAKLMLKYFNNTWQNSYDVTRGLFVNVPTLLIDIKNFNNRPEYIDRIKDADLVIWDDLAFGRLTDYEHEQLLQFIDYRIANNKSNIYTSNITDYETLKSSVGGRLASRIFNGSTVIEFKSDDFRAGGKL